jgi:hypothetical protein
MKRMLRLALLLPALGLVWAYSESASAAETHKWGQVTPEEWAYQPPADYPHVPAVVLFDLGSTEVGYDIKGERYMRHKIFDSHSAGEVINVEILVHKDDDFGAFTAQTLLPNGKKIHFNSMDLMKKKIGDLFEVYSFSFPGVENGCIVEMKYDLTSRTFSRGLPGWQFQNKFYTCESQFSFATLPNYIFNTVSIGPADTAWVPVEEEAKVKGRKTKRFTWKLTNLAPLVDEPYSGAELNFRPGIYLTLAGTTFWEGFSIKLDASWSDLERTLSTFYDYSLLSNDTLQAVVDSLIKTSASDFESQLRCLTAFVRDQITTTPETELLIWPSQTTTETLARRAGSPVDKNLLLTVMCQSLKFDANPLLISSRTHARFSTTVMNTTQFNHVLCYVVNGLSTYALDASDKDFPFPHLAPRYRADGGLLLTGDRLHRYAHTGDAQRISDRPLDTLRLTLPDWRSGVQNHASLWLNNDGSATCSTHVTVMGYDQALLKDIADKKLTADVLTKLLPGLGGKNISVVESVRSPESNSDSTAFDVVFTVSDFSSVTGDLISCTPSLIAPTFNPFTNTPRQSPIVFQYKYFCNESLDLRWSAGGTVPSPANATQISPSLIYTRNVLQDGKSARIISGLMVKKVYFPPESYPEVRKFFDLVSASASEPFSATIK